MKRRNIRSLTRMLLCTLMILCLVSGLASAPAENRKEDSNPGTTQADLGQPAKPETVNPTDQHKLAITAISKEQVTDDYLAAVVARKEGYNPSSVLITGVLYAPEGTEILSATVDCGAEAHKISGNSIYRMQTDYEPEKLKELPFKPDKNRAVFAFIVDLTQDQLSEGKNKAKVTLTLAGKKKIKFSTTIVTDSSKGRFYHPIPAAFDQAMYETYRGEALERLQARLVELNYLKPEEVTGVCDERTMAACNSLLADNGFPKEEQNDKYLTAKAMGFIESDQVKAREVKDFISTLKGNVRLFNLDIPLWALIAAGAALVALAVLIPLLIIGKKRKSKGQQADETEEPALNSVITSADNMKDQILTIGDEPTMDLSSAGEPEAGAVFGEDEATTELKEPGYILRVRMFYQDVYLDKNLKLMENSQAVIGRGSGATIQTNPEDVSISHRHGVFTAVQGKINYQDESRNGTIFNGQRTIHKGETISIPLNTKVQLEIGAHKILLIAAREN